MNNRKEIVQSESSGDGKGFFIGGVEDISLCVGDWFLDKNKNRSGVCLDPLKKCVVCII